MIVYCVFTGLLLIGALFIYDGDNFTKKSFTIGTLELFHALYILAVFLF